MNTFVKNIQYIFVPILFIVTFIRCLHIITAFKNTLIITKNDIKSHKSRYDKPNRDFIRESILRK
jgi:hypothetical protein